MAFLFKYHALSNHTRVITFFLTGTVVWACSVKNVFLQISQNSQENTCVGVFFTKLQELSTWHTRKVGPMILRWDLGPRTLRWDPRVGLQDGNLRCDPKLGPFSLKKLLTTFTNTMNLELMFVSSLLFLICCNCPKVWLEVNITIKT